MSDFLKAMAGHSAERATAAGEFRSADFERPVYPLTLSDFDVIAEIKDRSPATGDLAATNSNRGARAQQYVSGGAAAISVLTEPSRFAGDLAHLDEVAAAAGPTPVMRKDFLVEPVQILEARKHGASGVLLIVTMLSDQKLREMLDVAYEHKLFVLLESFDADDVRRSAKLLNNAKDRQQGDDGQLLVGINTRNLRTLEVDTERLQKLASELPAVRAVAESGLCVADDARTVASWGYRMALVGTALMQSDDPADLIRAMRRAGAHGIST